MPNWVANKLVITGEEKYLNKLREQMSQPYDTHHHDPFTNSIKHDTREGVFQLWNIVRPTNLEAYYEYEKHTERAEARKNAPPTPPMEAGEVLNKLMEGLKDFDIQSAMSEFQKQVEVGQGWYEWNIREWGTKWEIDGASLTQKPGELRYDFATAWSPPVSALDKLAAQYPQVVMTIRFHDEGDCFAGEIHWRNGMQEFETEIDINHGLMIEMYDHCWACDDHADDPDHAEYKERMKCDEFNKPIEIDEVL